MHARSKGQLQINARLHAPLVVFETAAGEGKNRGATRIAGGQDLR